MAKTTASALSVISTRIHSLLHDDVIEHTIVVMRELGSALSQVAGQIGREDAFNDRQREDLKATLLTLTSESIREALHKGELPITNGIIRSKNRILTTLGVEIPESHQEIDARKYPHYSW